MEVVCAFLVLGCAFLLSFLASNPFGDCTPQIDKIIGSPPGGGDAPVGGALSARSGLKVDSTRKQELIQTVQGDPEATAETLKQWIQE